MNNNEIVVTFARSGGNSFSLDPKMADEWTNLFLLDQLISTFYKSTSDGRSLPYIAKSLTADSSETVWTLTMIDGFTDETGVVLTPTYWKEGIKYVLTRVDSPKEFILLSQLSGWNEYIQGKNEIPIIADDESMTITLRFANKPEGLKEFLAMPVMGFWNTAKSESFVSTGPYTIERYAINNIDLSAKVHNKSNIRKVLVRAVAHSPGQPFEIKANEILYPNSDDQIKGDHDLVTTIPIKLIFAEINHDSETIKASPQMGNALAGAIHEYKNLKPYLTAATRPTNSLYLDIQDGYENINRVTAKPVDTLRVAVYGESIDLIHPYTKDIVDNSIAPLAKHIEYIPVDSSPEKWQRIINRDYDIRFGSVNAGTFPNKWVTEMMFCTEQGISFIDPKGKIRELLNDTSPFDEAKSGVEINRIISSESAIVPLYNRSYSIAVGKMINSSAISSNNPLPSLEFLRMNERF